MKSRRRLHQEGTPEMSLDLTPKQRIHIFFSNLLAKFGLDRRVTVEISKYEDYYVASIPGRKLAIPSAKRWRNYKRGWDYRTSRLLYQFGLGDVVHVGEGDVVIDIGANIGEFSVAVAELGAKVHAIEGDPLVFKCLTFNTATEKNLVRHNNVVWKEDTTLTFFSEPTEANSSVFQPMGDAPVKALNVTALRLDFIAENFGIGQVAFLKCDAEGAEPEVIEGGRELLSRTRAAAFDTGPERMGEETSNACEALLRELGFEVSHSMRKGRKITFGIRTAPELQRN
jgi:FkbM family methyltransferase